MLRALRAEIAKLSRSYVPLWTALVVVLWPLWSIFIVRLSNGSLDDLYWKELMELGAQGVSSWWGVLLGGFVAAYVFGQEYSEGTAHNMLALPVRREWFVVAKLALLLVWVFALAALSVAAHAGYAALLRLDGFALEHVMRGLSDSMLVTVVIAATLPLVAFIAVLGRGYLAPMIFSGVAFATGVLVLQAGWERWYPWGMAFALVGMGWMPGETKSSLTTGSWVILGAVFLAGVAALVVQIDYADCLE